MNVIRKFAAIATPITPITPFATFAPFTNAFLAGNDGISDVGRDENSG
jgi:hypothetical protein